MSDTKKMPVWPGPRVMVPMPTDVLLIGQPDFNADTDWATTQNSYFNLWNQTDSANPVPFGKGTSPAVGAHVMWTLPFTLRSGASSQDPKDNGAVNFPYVPNRWLVTRFAYGTPGTAPTVTAKILRSDALYDIQGNPNDYNQYPYPEDANYPVRGIGKTIELASWTGPAGPDTSFLQAVGPGDISWSVGYDNIKNVFALHDPLGTETATYTYSIAGWYADPATDALYNLPTDTNANWMSMLESTFKWTVGDATDLTTAIQDWQTWQADHGLTGTWDPSSIHLPAQSKVAIEAWHTWQQANGSTASESALPRQLLCHSMLATVVWQGNTKSYGTGVPEGGESYPHIAIGNSASEAISTYMANRVVEQYKQSKEDIPVIERALHALQTDLLYDLATDPVKVEMALQGTRFSTGYGGQRWIVVLPENTEEEQTGKGGQQSVPLNTTQTQTLTDLNALQDEVNALYDLQQTQRTELFSLTVKSSYMTRRTPTEIRTAVEQSITVMEAALQQTLTDYETKKNKVAGDAATFEGALKPDFILKAIDMQPAAAPNDPVIMIGGGKTDTKLFPPSDLGEDELLFVRFTGQTVTGIEVSFNVGGANTPKTIQAEQILGKITMPAWNAIPKEVMDLWVEATILDTSNAGLLADIYFEMRGVTPSDDDKTKLTAQIQAQQTAIWNNSETLGYHPQSVAEVAGIKGILPSVLGVGFRTEQPWTPVFMDWRVMWYPDSTTDQDALKNWELQEIDYNWRGSSIPQTGIEIQGRTVLNAKTARNIQEKLSTFQDDPAFDGLPDFVITDLSQVAEDIGKLDLLTQSVSGFTNQLITQISNMAQFPDGKPGDLIGDANTNYIPDVGTTTKSPDFFPIRSGHISLIDLWVVDSFGQVLSGKDSLLPAKDPIPGIYWSESLTTSSPNYTGDTENFGQLPPRLSQMAGIDGRLLKSTDDTVFTNSSDLTSPICGWIMPNHLDNSLIIFDAAGVNQGEIIKVDREVPSGERQYTIRWDAVPGSNSILGAPPELENQHLQNLVNGLLETGFEGALAYDDFVASIDSSLWTLSNFKNESGNLPILLGRPLAVVRAEVSLSLSGNPAYNQGWLDTGRYYNQNGTYHPTNPPFMSVPFSLRIGDSLMEGNGVIGYYEADNYDKFYSVYGSNAQATLLLQELRKGNKNLDADHLSEAIQTGKGFSSDYIGVNHQVKLASDATTVKVTVLVDPSGNIPFIPGALPVSSVALPNGPVSNALEQLKAFFRAGPLLLDPSRIQMPTPAQVAGNWGWAARKDVTSWNEEIDIDQYTPIATLETNPLKLIEGWMTLSGAESIDENP